MTMVVGWVLKDVGSGMVFHSGGVFFFCGCLLFILRDISEIGQGHKARQDDFFSSSVIRDLRRPPYGFELYCAGKDTLLAQSGSQYFPVCFLCSV